MGTNTTLLSLYKPTVGEQGWGALRNTSYDTIDTALGTQHGLTGVHRYVTVDDATGYIKFPELTTIQRDALPATIGFTIYNTDNAALETFQAGSWQTVVTPQLTVEEQDFSPSVTGVNTIQFPNDTLTDLGSGVVSVDGFLTHSEGVQNGDILYFDGVFWSRIAPGVAGQRLITNAAGAAPSWETALPIPVGLNIGDMLYYDGANWVSLVPGLGGQILQTNAIGNAPSWITPTGGGNVSTALNLTDNAIVRGDGGAAGVQTSAILIDDSDNITGVVNFTTTGTVTFNGVTYTYPGADGTSGFVLSTNGSGTLSWVAQSGGGGSTFTDDVFRVQDDGDNSKEIAFQAAAITTSTTRTITMPDADVDLGDIATNNAKVTNATHTTDVTGSVALTVDPVAITNKPAATVASGDLVLVSDIDDSNNLKQVTAQSIGDLGGGGGGATLTEDVNQTTHGFSTGEWVYHNGTIYALADASAASTAESIGVVSAVAGVDDFTIQFGGKITGLSGLTTGEAHFLSETAGAITATAPTTSGAVSKPVLIADSATSGFIFNMRGSLNTDTTSFVQSFTDADLTAGVLSVNHGFGRQYIVVQVFDDSDLQIIPDEVDLIDGNNTDIDLTSFGTITGTWNAVLLDTGATVGTGPTLPSFSQTFVDGDLTAGVIAITHSLGNQYPVVQIYDNSGNVIIPDEITATDANTSTIDLSGFGTLTGTWRAIIVAASGTAATSNATYNQSFVDADLTAGVLTVAHSLSNQYNQVQVFNNSDELVMPDDITLTDANNLDVDLTSFGTLTGTWNVVVLAAGGTIGSNATDLSLAGQAAEDFAVFNGTNWVTRGGTEKIVNGLFSRDTSLASGNQAVTGVGFQPSYITFHGCVPGTSGMSIGACDGDLDNHCGFSDINPTIAGAYTSSSVYAIQMREGTSALQYQGLVASMDSDGFTITWTKTGATTGTANIYFTAHR